MNFSGNSTWNSKLVNKNEAHTILECNETNWNKRNYQKCAAQSQNRIEMKRKTDENDTKCDSFHALSLSFSRSLHMTECCKYKKLFSCTGKQRSTYVSSFVHTLFAVCLLFIYYFAHHVWLTFQCIGIPNIAFRIGHEVGPNTSLSNSSPRAFSVYNNELRMNFILFWVDSIDE